MKHAPLLLAVIILSGCLAGSEPTREPSPTRFGRQAIEPQEVFRNNFSASGGFGVAAGDLAQVQAANAASFEVWPNATAIRATLKWTSIGNVADLDFTISLPSTPQADLQGKIRRQLGESTPGVFGNYGGRVGSPDSPATLEIDADQLRPYLACAHPPCSWLLYVFADPAGADIRWDADIRLDYPRATADPEQQV